MAWTAPFHRQIANAGITGTGTVAEDPPCDLLVVTVLTAGSGPVSSLCVTHASRMD